MSWSDLQSIFLAYGSKFILAIVVLIGAGFLISFMIKSLERVLQRIKIDSTITSLLRDMLKFILWILTIALVLNMLGFKEISLALGGSIAVVALGLSKSISSVASDLISGIFLLADEDFKVGNLVETSGVKGIVESLDIRKTKIRDEVGNLHIIPNKKIDGSNLIIVDFNNRKSP